ncbi:MAG: serine/threonine-protein phosphatase [Phycisphaerales bacterium]|nr:MAG: serine/threonine-protein phosphatase [Phycisphaerales bacterium]
MTTATTQNEMGRKEAQSHALQCMEVWGGNREIQSGITVPGIDGWISSEPYHAQERGGDIHYLSLCGMGKISRFTIADVSGHGDSAADVADRLRALLRKHINTVDQTKLARALNREFNRLAESGRFATALLATYFAPTDHLIICNAGHPRPLWYSAETNTWRLLDEHMSWQAESVRNLPLGVIQPTEYSQFAVKLGRGDLVLLYTDSLIEARDRDGARLGEAGLLELAADIGPTEPEVFVQELTGRADAHRGGEAPDDDQTLLVLHHNGESPPPPSMSEKIRIMAKMVGLLGE